MVYFLVYVSSAVGRLDRTELDAILLSSRRTNAALGVTGALMYEDGNIMQVLEGEQEVVTGLYERIRRDPRHHDVNTVYDVTGPREFDGWAMAHAELAHGNDAEAQQARHLLASLPSRPDIDAGIRRSLLTTFRRSLNLH